MASRPAASSEPEAAPNTSSTDSQPAASPLSWPLTGSPEAVLLSETLQLLQQELILDQMSKSATEAVARDYAQRAAGGLLVSFNTQYNGLVEQLTRDNAQTADAARASANATLLATVTSLRHQCVAALTLRRSGGAPASSAPGESSSATARGGETSGVARHSSAVRAASATSAASSGGGAASNRGLRHQASRVAERVAAHREAPFQTIADDLLKEMRGGAAVAAAEEPGELKKIGRRVYDILNVLSAVRVVETFNEPQGAKWVRWRGFPSPAKADLLEARLALQARQTELDTLRAKVVEIAEQAAGLSALRRRNRRLIALSSTAAGTTLTASTTTTTAVASDHVMAEAPATSEGRTTPGGVAASGRGDADPDDDAASCSSWSSLGSDHEPIRRQERSAATGFGAASSDLTPAASPLDASIKPLVVGMPLVVLHAPTSARIGIDISGPARRAVLFGFSEPFSILDDAEAMRLLGSALRRCADGQVEEWGRGAVGSDYDTLAAEPVIVEAASAIAKLVQPMMLPGGVLSSHTSPAAPAIPPAIASVLTPSSLPASAAAAIAAAAASEATERAAALTARIARRTRSALRRQVPIAARRSAAAAIEAHSIRAAEATVTAAIAAEAARRISEARRSQDASSSLSAAAPATATTAIPSGRPAHPGSTVPVTNLTASSGHESSSSAPEARLSASRRHGEGDSPLPSSWPAEAHHAMDASELPLRAMTAAEVSRAGSQAYLQGRREADEARRRHFHGYVVDLGQGVIRSPSKQHGAMSRRTTTTTTTTSSNGHSGGDAGANLFDILPDPTTPAWQAGDDADPLDGDDALMPYLSRSPSDHHRAQKRQRSDAPPPAGAAGGGGASALSGRTVPAVAATLTPSEDEDHEDDEDDDEAEHGGNADETRRSRRPRLVPPDGQLIHPATSTVDQSQAREARTMSSSSSSSSGDESAVEASAARTARAMDLMPALVRIAEEASTEAVQWSEGAGRSVAELAAMPAPPARAVGDTSSSSRSSRRSQAPVGELSAQISRRMSEREERFSRELQRVLTQLHAAFQGRMNEAPDRHTEDAIEDEYRAAEADHRNLAYVIGKRLAVAHRVIGVACALGAQT